MPGSPSSRLSRSRYLSAALLAIYFIVMFPLLDRLERSWEYASYVFEALFIAAVWIVFRPRLSVKFSVGARSSALLALDVFGMLVFGFAIFRIAEASSLPNPFDLRSPELLVFLFVIGPLIEELVFRGALWELFGHLIPPRWPATPVLLIVTTVIFSFAHFFAWWGVPADLHSFVIYQSVYTLFLGAYCGLRRARTRSIAVPILAHVCFNAGFYLGFCLRAFG